MYFRRLPFAKMFVFAALLLFVFSKVAFAGFAPPVIYQADVATNSVALGDFNLDGHTDVAATNLLSNDVSTLLGNGDGTFQPAVNYPVGLAPTGAVETCGTAGAPFALAVINSGSNTVSLLNGNGDGTFQPTVDYELGNGISPQAIVTGDFNGDGYCDLVVASASGGTKNNGNIAILLGNPDGTFQPAVNYDTLGVEPVAITVNEFNGDFFTDLGVANFSSNSVTIFLGDGLGGFTASGDYPVGIGPTSLVSNHVGGLRLVTTNSGSNTISRLDNTGNGTFNHSTSFAAGGMPVSISQGILTGLSVDSLAVADEADNAITVFPEKSTKPYLKKTITFPTCSSPTIVIPAQLRPQRPEDLVVVCSEGVGVMLNTQK